MIFIMKKNKLLFKSIKIKFIYFIISLEMLQEILDSKDGICN